MKPWLYILLIGLLAILLSHQQVFAQNLNQFWLAAQHDWGSKRGFFLTLGAPFAPGQPARLEDVKLTLGVGDGSQWHFLETSHAWQLDRTYRARAVIADGAAELWLDDRRVARQQVKLMPTASRELVFNQQPSFLRGPARYAVRQMQLLARSAKSNPVEISIAPSKLPPQLLLFNPGAGADTTAVSIDVTDSVTIEVGFQLVAAPDLRALAPFVDRYGQSVQASWEGKLASDEDLKRSQQIEDQRLATWGEPRGLDKFGGLVSAPWKQQASGFFRVARHDGKWWLISPEGNPCFYIGLCDAPALNWEATPVEGREFLFEWLPPMTEPWAGAWLINPWHINEQRDARYLALHTPNLIRKYGQDWRRLASESAVRRAKVLGFSGFGKWSSAGLGVVDLPVLFHGEIANLVRHPDIFDPKIRQQWTELLRRQIEPRKTDPWLLGWSVGNEFDENITPDEIVKILAMPQQVPASRALIEHARETFGDSFNPAEPTPDQIEQLRRFYADRYYAFIYQTVKSIDPHHLYFGMWVTPNWWVDQADWDLIAPHCDVIGYDFYSRRFEDEPTGRLIARHDKPVLCGEFSFPPHYRGTRAFGRYHNSSEDDAESGRFYRQWIQDAAKNPNCVGVMYFQYRDQPITGRGPGPGGTDSLVQGENFAFGIVDVTDRLKWEFVEHVREANLSAAAARLGMAGSGNGGSGGMGQ
ncbi:hypothetical protein [Fontivita pretiosa]|uniref:hypothetical protein n=1 Tax=Fontivita pretiosa TaxID=2989684 RepID=UPI003D16BB0D